MSHPHGARGLLDLAATVSIIVAALAVTWNVVMMQRVSLVNQPTIAGPSPQVEDVVGTSLTIGLDIPHADRPRASVAVIEFSDFECPFCGRYALETLPRLKAEFLDSNKLIYEFKNFPLESLHSQARNAATAAECAERQGRFWEMHQWLFANQKTLSADAISARARALSIDDKCLQEMDSEVAKDMAEGARLNVNSTPTFFLGEVRGDGTVSVRRRIRGAVPYDIFKTEITKLIASTEKIQTLSRIGNSLSTESHPRVASGLAGQQVELQTRRNDPPNARLRWYAQAGCTPSCSQPALRRATLRQSTGEASRGHGRRPSRTASAHSGSRALRTACGFRASSDR